MTLRIQLTAALLGLASLFALFTPAFAQAALTCSPARQSVQVGQSVTLTADGGTGTYTWASADEVVRNTSNDSFTTRHNVAETTTVVVTSGGESALCVIDVLSAAGTQNPIVQYPQTGTYPGLPNTGAETSVTALMLTALVAVLLFGGLAFFGKKAFGVIRS